MSSRANIIPLICYLCGRPLTRNDPGDLVESKPGKQGEMFDGDEEG